MGSERENIPVLKPGLEMIPSIEPQPGLDETGRKLFNDTHNAILKVVSDKEKTATGFLIEDGTRFITTARAVLDTKEQFAIGPDGKRHKAEIQSLDDINDIAVLRLKGGQIPGTKTVELGSSADLEEDQKVYTMSIPGKASEPYMAPGYARGLMSPIQLLASMSPAVVGAIQMKSRELDFPSKMEARMLLGRPLYETKTHIERGSGGGPMFDESGKVIAMTQLSNGTNPSLGRTLSSPAEAADALLKSGGKFDVSYKASGEAWAEQFREKLSENKLEAAGSALVVGGLGYAGYLSAQRFPLMGGGVAAYGLYKFSSDAEQLLSSSDSTDKLKYGLATVSDLGTAAGGVMTFAPKLRGYGLALAAVGIVGRAGSDFIRNHWQVDEFKRKDGSNRPPASFDKLLGMN